MDLSHFHFMNPYWLLGLALIPLVMIAHYLLAKQRQPYDRLKHYIDSHLLAYLLVDKSDGKQSYWKPLLLWSLVWFFLTIALAGPRWSFKELETFAQDQNLVVLLDLSESMNAQDITPTRLGRAKQKIHDLLKLSQGVKIGLIVFAADPHMITPLTDDKETILALLPSLETDLVHIQGSRLSSALEMASNMLQSEGGRNNALLVISDGGFEDASAIITARKLAEKGLTIHTMGIGSVEGVHVKAKAKKNEISHFTKLESEKLQAINQAANGKYLEADYSDVQIKSLLKELKRLAEAPLLKEQKRKFWDERFYLVILPLLPIFLWWFKRGSLFLVIFLIFTHSSQLASLEFKNSEQLGKEAFEEEDYERASEAFQDPYRKGVAYYKAQKFKEAEECFRGSTRENISLNAAYNLANALAAQQKLKEAKKAYEDVLKQCPEHKQAKENLDVINQLLEQQKQDSSNSDSSDKKESQDENQKQDSQDGNEGKDNQEPQDQQENKDNQDQQENKDNQDQQKPDDKQIENESQNNQDGQDPSNEEKQNDTDLDEPKDQQNEEEKLPQDLNDEEQPKDSEQNELPSQQQDQMQMPPEKSMQDQEADQWLNRISCDPSEFLKNKFYIESKRNGTIEGINPW